jgi:hypothetical protein
MENKKDMAKSRAGLLFKTGGFMPVVEESKLEELPTTPTKTQWQTKSKTSKAKHTVRKTFNIPDDIDEDVKKLLYMNRDVKDYTDLLIIALKDYIHKSKNQALIEEYHTIKGVKKND